MAKTSVTENVVTHTSGPWRVFTERFVERGDLLIDIVDANINTICEFNGSDNEVERHLANAHLIAAAPDLLAALKAIVEHEQIDGTGIRYVFDWHSPFGKQARAAIAKAEGRS